mmetsp:Transcript_10037/g.16033  ORF Transcript_10037/g.16033 Transcript_10037/m.16033 type:complete len:532 (-) Transcript_10037:66-1661(-)
MASTQAKVQDSIIQCFSPTHEEAMSDEDEGWEETGAFPRGSPRIQCDTDHIFVDNDVLGPYDSLAIVDEASRETASSSQDGLMGISHASSDITPAMSNTASAVRDALKKQNKLNKSGDSKIGRFYPFNVYQSLSSESAEEKKNSHNPNGTSAPSGGENAERKTKTTNDREQPSSHHVQATGTMDDENSSAITEDQQDHSVPPSLSIISARSRRHGGGSKHHWVRHTLASTQQISANPTSMLKNLFVNIEQERHMHKLTAQHLRAIHNWLLFLPSIILTLGAGVLALVFEADLKSSDTIRVYSSIAVGVIALISVFWQGVSKQLDLGVKSALHGATSIALKRLSEDILLTLSAAESIPAEYVALIGEKFGQAVDACPSSVPYKLDAAFSALSDRMVLMFRPPGFGNQAPRKYVQKLDFIRLYATAYDELSAVIIDYLAFPFAFPNPRTASDNALSNFKSIVTEGREVDRSRLCRKWLCPCFASPDEERSLFDVLPAANQFEHSISTQNPVSTQIPVGTQNPIRNYMLGTEVY